MKFCLLTFPCLNQTGASVYELFFKVLIVHVHLWFEALAGSFKSIDIKPFFSYLQRGPVCKTGWPPTVSIAFLTEQAKELIIIYRFSHG